MVLLPKEHPMETTTTTESITSIGREGAELRELRQRAGVSRAQLAGIASCSVTMIANIESGYVPARSGVVTRIRAALSELGTDVGAAQGE